MKLRAAFTAAVVTVASFVTIGTGSAMTASAADLVTLVWDDFECYSASMISGYTDVDGTSNPPTISMDTTTGANGTSNSMKVELVNGSESYNFWRSVPEDNYILCNQYYEMAETGTETELYFTFWAKASEPTTMKAYLYVKENIYQPTDWTCNLSTEWQQYAYKVTDAVGVSDSLPGYGETILWGILNKYSSNRPDAYIHGLRFDKESNWEGTIWIDEIAFTGTTFSMGAGDLPTDTLDESDMDVMHYADTATHGATSVIMPAAVTDTAAASSDTTATEESSTVEETASEEASSEEETSSEEEDTSSTVSSKTTTSATADDGGGLSTGAIIAIIVAIVVVVAAGVVGFIFYRKKSAAAQTDEESEETDES